MFSLSPIKILIIVVVILVVLGPDKLPEVSHQLGTAWKKLRTLQQKIEGEVREVVPDLPTSADIVRIARSPMNLLNSLADRAMTSSDGEEAGGWTPTPSPDDAEHEVAPITSAHESGSSGPPAAVERHVTSAGVNDAVTPFDPSLN